MKIIMVADQYPPIVGGTERQAEKLARALVRRHHEVVVLTGRWNRSMTPREEDHGVQIERLSTLCSMGGIRGFRKFGHDLYTRSLRQALQRHLPHADVVHAHFMRGGAAVAIVEAERAGVPALVKETSSGPHNSFHRLTSVRHGKKLRSVFLEHLRHVAVLNDDARQEYEDLPFADLTVHSTVNGVQLYCGHPIWVPNESRRILFLGRLQAIKGAAELIEAFATAAPQLPGWTLRICGDGEELERLEALSARLHISDRVEFPGFSPTPIEELADCAMLALPSRAEGMSNTMLEAMAVGTPIVATMVGANPRTLVDGAGWLVAPRSVSALAETLVAAACDEEERLRRGLRARKRADAVYSLDVVGASFESLYERLCDSVCRR